MDAPTSLAFHSIAQSNLAPEKKTSIRRFFERVTGATLAPGYDKAVSVAAEGGQLLRQDGEALIIGAGLGLLAAEGKLDVGKNNNFPIDGAIAGAGAIGALLLANHPLGVAPDLRNASAIALGILSFRKVQVWREKQKGTAGTTSGPSPSAHGDPIVALAKEFA